MYGHDRNYNFFLSFFSRYCFCMDSFRNYRTDYVYHGESFPCSKSVSFYVRRGYQLLHPYQKLLIVSVLVCLLNLFTGMVVFAETELLVKDQITFTEMDKPILRSPSINPAAPFEIKGYEIIEGNNPTSFKFSLIFEGIPEYPLYIYRTNHGNDTTGYVKLNSSNDYITGEFLEGRQPTEIFYVSQLVDNIQEPIYQVNRTFTYNDVGYSSTNVGQNTYLSLVGTVFTWLLTSVGALISFIVGNAFLGCCLFLFVAGSVISFFIRIRS